VRKVCIYIYIYAYICVYVYTHIVVDNLNRFSVHV
jgi:hypothetical protein